MHRKFLSLLAILALSLGLACAPAEAPTDAEPEPAIEESAAPSGDVEFVAADFSFTGPPEMASGWNHLTFRNDGEQPHFMVLWQLPEGKAFSDYTAEITPVFVDNLHSYNAGEIDRDQLLAAIGGGLPAWLVRRSFRRGK